MYPLLVADADDWVNTFSEGNYCTSFGYRQLGANTTVTLAACKAQCLSNPACGAIYSQSSGSITAVCQLYPKDACVTPAGRQNNTFNAVNGRIHLAAGIRCSKNKLPCATCAVLAVLSRSCALCQALLAVLLQFCRSCVPV